MEDTLYRRILYRKLIQNTKHWEFMNRHTVWSLRDTFFWLQFRIAGYLTGMNNNVVITTIAANLTYFCIWKSTQSLSAHEVKGKHEVHSSLFFGRFSYGILRTSWTDFWNAWLHFLLGSVLHLRISTLDYCLGKQDLLHPNSVKDLSKEKDYISLYTSFGSNVLQKLYSTAITKYYW